MRRSAGGVLYRRRPLDRKWTCICTPANQIEHLRSRECDGARLELRCPADLNGTPLRVLHRQRPSAIGDGRAREGDEGRNEMPPSSFLCRCRPPRSLLSLPHCAQFSLLVSRRRRPPRVSREAPSMPVLLTPSFTAAAPHSLPHSLRSDSSPPHYQGIDAKPSFIPSKKNLALFLFLMLIFLLDLDAATVLDAWG